MGKLGHNISYMASTLEIKKHSDDYFYYLLSFHCSHSLAADAISEIMKYWDLSIVKEKRVGGKWKENKWLFIE